MEQAMSYPAEKNSSNVYLDRKRKIQAELLGMPFSKHACWDRNVKNESSSDSSTQLKVDIDILATGSESDPESAVDSNSFSNDIDSIMYVYDDEETYPAYSKEEPCTSSSSWGVASSDIDLYSLHSRSLTTSNSNKRKSLSSGDDHCCPDHDNELVPSLSYEKHLLEFGNEGIECGTDKELDNLLQSYGIINNVSSSVDQDTREGSKNLTIDKEFEQYFSMLML